MQEIQLQWKKLWNTNDFYERITIAFEEGASVAKSATPSFLFHWRLHGARRVVGLKRRRQMTFAADGISLLEEMPNI